MTNDEAKKMLKSKLECLKHETSGTDYACNQHLCEGCSLNYEQGNMGEQKEALEMAIQALEQQPCEDCISREAVIEDVIKCTDMNTVRHELFHAIFHEAGLDCYAEDEVLVDALAILFPKIEQLIKEVQDER